MKYRIELPFTAFLIVDVEADNECEASEKVHPSWIYESARGGLACVSTGRLSTNQDCINWDKMEITKL